MAQVGNTVRVVNYTGRTITSATIEHVSATGRVIKLSSDSWSTLRSFYQIDPETYVENPGCGTAGQILNDRFYL